MAPIGWQQRLHGALTREDIVDLCGEFVRARTLVETRELPAECEPPLLTCPNDVNRYALTLIRHLSIGERASAPALYRLSVFFTKAALRLMQVPPRSADMRPQG